MSYNLPQYQDWLVWLELTQPLLKSHGTETRKSKNMPQSRGPVQDRLLPTALSVPYLQHTKLRCLIAKTNVSTRVLMGSQDQGVYVQIQTATEQLIPDTHISRPVSAATCNVEATSRVCLCCSVWSAEPVWLCNRLCGSMKAGVLRKTYTPVILF